MEGVGARLGRSSSRYGTTTVFTGPVRKWKKNWVPITPPSSSTNNSNHHNPSNGSINGSSNAASVSHLRLYKWTPLLKDSNTKNINNNNNSSPLSNVKIKRSLSDNSDCPVNDEDTTPEEPPKRRFKYIPVTVLEEQKKEDEEISDDEAKSIDANEDSGGIISKNDGAGEKPDINDVPMDENEDSADNQAAGTRQDLDELDLSLGLTSHDEEQDCDSKTEPNEDSRQPDRAKARNA